MRQPPRVLVTRAAHQGSELAQRLEELGLEPVQIPTIQLEPPSTLEPLEAALGQLAHFHWLVFTSANAVNAFHEFCTVRASKPTNRIAAIGAATAQALASAGWKVDLIPLRGVAESLAEALLPHVRQADGNPTRFLVPRAEEGREALPDTLRAAGAHVAVVPVYRTVIRQDSAALLRSLLDPEIPDLAAITFTSSSTARNFFALCEAAEAKPPADVLRISIGPITSETLRQLGYPAHAESPEPSVASLARTVLQSLHQTA